MLPPLFPQYSRPIDILMCNATAHDLSTNLANVLQNDYVGYHPKSRRSEHVDTENFLTFLNKKNIQVERLIFCSNEFEDRNKKIHL